MEDQLVETVIVRDRDEMWRLQQVNHWDALTMIGSLSADPSTFDELRRAWLRYRLEEPLDELPWEPAAAGEPQPGGWLLLDLALRRLAAGGGFELPEDRSAYQRDEGKWHREMPVVWVNLPPGWECEQAEAWPGVLRDIPAPVEPLDARGVLFGRPLAEGLARRTLQAAASETLPDRFVTWEELYDREESSSEELEDIVPRWDELTIRVHADWLTAPREDLGGEPPRPFLHRGREWVTRELHNRSMQWSHQLQAPRGLDRDTLAYRYGPLGLHEVVMYYDLCRELIRAAWSQIVQTPQIDESALTEQLHQHAQDWLAGAHPDGESRPPAEIIEHERRRIPLVSDGSHLDCDCPLCRMTADSPEPTFCGFDGHHLELDDEFAFSLCETRADWEEQQQRHREFSAKIEAEMREQEAAAAEQGADDELGQVWTGSFVAESEPPSVLSLAMRLTELVADLKQAGADEHVRQLNESFDSYRDVSHDPTLLRAAAAGMSEALEEVAAARPQLTSKCADLQSQLDEHQRQQ